MRQKFLTQDAKQRGSLPEQKYQAEWNRCKDDICYWVNTYVKTFDPRLLETDPVLPFHLFPRQEEFLRWLQAREAEQKSGLAEKSRDVGFTWLCVAFAVHGWLFRKGFTAGFGSRKVELVDKMGDPKCIFEKIRFVIRHLPSWMLPAGFNERQHSGFCKLLHPTSNASITGEGGAQVGRGGRTSIYFVDEAAFLQHPQLVDAALSANSRVKIWVSTPNGPGNPFAKKRFSGKIDVFTFHWRDDPRKDDAWYAQQKEELDEVTVAQEIDIDYTASIEGLVIPAKWVRAAVNLTEHFKFKAAFPKWKRSGPVVMGFDVASGGKNRSVLTFRRGIELFDIVDWSHPSVSYSAAKAADEAEKRHVSQFNFDGVGTGEAVTDWFNNTEREFFFLWLAVIGGNPASENTIWPDGRTSRERYINLRAEMWMKMRARFEKTFEFVEGMKQHPVDELISIPPHEDLIAQLSTPLIVRNTSDKIGIESKDNMRKRGIESPDFADSLAYTFAPVIGDWSDALTGEDVPVWQEAASTEKRVAVQPGARNKPDPDDDNDADAGKLAREAHEDEAEFWDMFDDVSEAGTTPW